MDNEIPFCVTREWKPFGHLLMLQMMANEEDVNDAEKKKIVAFTSESSMSLVYEAIATDWLPDRSPRADQRPPFRKPPHRPWQGPTSIGPGSRAVPVR